MSNDELKHLFYGLSGRIGRQQYWLGMLAVIGGFLALSLLIWTLGVLPPRALVALFIASAIVLVLIPSIAISVKRLHDHNKPGWWLIPFYVAPMVFDKISDRVAEDTVPWWVLVIVGLILSLWAVLELGFLRGTNGPNAYGPDPLPQRAV